MAGFLLHLPPPGARASADALAPARAWCEREQRLPVAGESHAWGSVVALGRRAADPAGFAADDRGWLAMAGSWSHPEVEPGDARVLLGLLRARGASVFDEVDGSFAAAWCEGEARSVTIALEPTGRLHVFLAETPLGAFAGTSATALACAIGAEPDPVAVHEFLATGTMYGDRTPFLGVRRLAGGRRYRLEPGKGVRVEEGGARSRARGSAEGVLEAGVAAVRAVLRGRRDPLADLTGGLDSRFVVGLMLAAGLRPEVTVTGSEGDPDVRVATRLAAALGLPLLHVRPGPPRESPDWLDRVLDAAALADGMYDAVEYAGIAAIHERHARTHGCSVNGSGGEILRSYWWSRRDLRPDAAVDAKRAARRFTATAPEFLAPAPLPDLAAHFEAVVETSLARAPDRTAPDRLDHLYLDLRMQCWQGAIASATNRIWPTLSPLLCRGVVAAALAVPPRARLGGRLFRELFARLAPPLRECPLASGPPPAFEGRLRGLPATLGNLARKAWRRAVGRRRDAGGARRLDERVAVRLADYLAPRALALAPLVDASRFERWRREEGERSPILGRLLALERALRAAKAAARPERGV